MAKALIRNGTGSSRRGGITTKYDAHQKVLSQTYGALADLRRELSDSKETVAEREELLRNFSVCADSQRAWLLLEDYFERLSLSRKDFPATDWWPRMLAARGNARLEELAFLFLRAHRSPPTELAPHANLRRFAEVEEAAQEQRLVRELENWLFPQQPVHLDTPRASLRVVCQPQPDDEQPARCRLAVRFHLLRPRTGEKVRSLAEILELTTRAAHEQELFPPGDWEFIQWLAATHQHRRNGDADSEMLILADFELLHWLARWGHTSRLESAEGRPLRFRGLVAELTPHLENGDHELSFTHRLTLPDGTVHRLPDLRFFTCQPPLTLAGDSFYLLRNAPPPGVLELWTEKPSVPVRKLSHRLLTQLRRTQASQGLDWEGLCITHPALPRFIFELLDDTVRLRLSATSKRDRSTWFWNGHEWQLQEARKTSAGKPEILDDPRLEPATQWLRQLDWFTPEPGLWIGDANENFLGTLARAWPVRPPEAEYLGNPAFQRLFLSPRQLKPRLVVKGSGIDWLAVSAEWEQEGLKLTAADLQRLAAATSRFVKLPDSGWVELDTAAVQTAHEAMADLGVDGLAPAAQRIGLEQAAHLDEEGLQRFGDSPQARSLRERLKNFEGIPATELPANVQAELRPYQKDGFDFLCHLTQLKLGGILADDMGLGKTIQVLALLLSNQHDDTDPKPAPSLLVIPASLLGNWRSEAARFAPSLKLCFLHPAETDRQTLTDIAAAPEQHLADTDLVVTTYAMLTRQPWLADVHWRLVILDEAQAIKNPSTRQSRAARKLLAQARIALTGTPVENRLGDLWALFDFLNPGLLGSAKVFQSFMKSLQARDENPFTPLRQLVSPYILRRLKTDRSIIADLPEKTEMAGYCHLTRPQVKLYEQVVRAMQRDLESTDDMARRGVVLRSLLRLKQVCNHPSQLLGDADYKPDDSGKFLRLAEICEELAARQEKVLIFTQFREIIDPLAEHLAAIFDQSGLVLHGATRVKERRALVDQFQRDDGPPFFILSLKAGGTGLNLTAASHVIHFDRWWNPAVENQATDRAFRIGQIKNVLVHKFVCRGTVEDKIDGMIEAKQQLAGDFLDGGAETVLTEMANDELLKLVSLDLAAAMKES